MNNNAWFKKENPLLSLHSMGGGAAGTLMQGAADKTYVDEVFSPYADIGTGFARTIVNNIDLADKGGLVWQKWRSGSASANDNNTSHILADTVRGTSKYLKGNTNDDEFSVSAVGSFNSNGYATGGNLTSTDNSNDKYISWTFAKQEGFFDIATWTGNSSYDQTISHNLGCEPGCIMYKSLSASGSWYVYHRGATKDKFLSLNSTAAASTFSDTLTVTSTQFVAPGELGANADGETYVAYLFAGGESEAATARSVDFDGTGDYLNTTSSSSDFTMGTGDFTVECWVKKDNITDAQGIFQISSTSGGLEGDPNYGSTIAAAYGDHWHTYGAGNFNEDSSETPARKGQWQHVAYVRHSGTSKFYVDGEELISYTDTTNYNGTYIAIGGYYSTTYLMDGAISNFRVVKGTAVYTSSFIPPTKPLTSISGTVLLCCNNSSTTGSTTTPVTINSNGDPTASTDSPFDDPAGFKFGDNKEGIVKCGRYVGNGSSSAPPEIYLGWEPQWVMVKRIDGSGQDWVMVDSMRGMFRGLSQTPHLRANSNNAEQDTSYYRIDVSSGKGFAPFTTDNGLNGNGDEYIYMAIRRPDGYVGKPAEAGTDVFTMDTGNASTTIPAFDSNFPVDFGLQKTTGTVTDWAAVTRLMGPKELNTNTTDAEASGSAYVWDSNVGYTAASWADSGMFSWMWKRGQGFDVSTYKATGYALSVAHGLSQVPEMYWIKNRDDSKPWIIYHKDLNGGTNPNQYYLQFDIDAEATISPYAAAPTATHFNIAASESWTNDTGDDYITMLFASANDADGNPISKVGSYSGSGGAQTITTGFQPRFVIIKRTDAVASWFVFDTVRGWSSGADPYLLLDSTAAQDGAYDMGSSESNGFSLINDSNTNASGGSYIYYAHA